MQRWLLLVGCSRQKILTETFNYGAPRETKSADQRSCWRRVLEFTRLALLESATSPVVGLYALIPLAFEATSHSITYSLTETVTAIRS
jgi:hypothetical protein